MTEKITQEELTELIVTNKDHMFRIAFSFLHNASYAQDAVGETIVRAFECRNQLRNKESGRAWLMRILMNESRKLLKKQARFVAYERDVEGDCEVYKVDEEGVLEYVSGLPLKFREVTFLYYFERFSVSEISSILGISQGTVKSRLSRSRDKLYNMMVKDGYHHG